MISSWSESNKHLGRKVLPLSLLMFTHSGEFLFPVSSVSGSLLTLEPASLVVKHASVSREDTWPCALNNYWILDLSAMRQSLLDHS